MNILFIILDFFIAGTESTSTTMLWGIAYLIRHPDIQRKCREEILEVVGDQQVCLTDREELSYVEATLCEIQRIANIAPHAIMHCTDGPVELEGYFLPDKTLIPLDLYSVHMDPEIWEEPETFNPDRFLDEKGRLYKPPSFIPFSVGRRACPGENLAKTELFLLFTSLVKSFVFTTTDITKIPTVADGTLGVTLLPPLYDVIATPVE